MILNTWLQVKLDLIPHAFNMSGFFYYFNKSSCVCLIIHDILVMTSLARFLNICLIIILKKNKSLLSWEHLRFDPGHAIATWAYTYTFLFIHLK